MRPLQRGAQKFGWGRAIREIEQRGLGLRKGEKERRKEVGSKRQGEREERRGEEGFKPLALRFLAERGML